MKKMFSIKAIVFIAAFLLFQIELIISKLLLPKFGGSYTVWGAAIVFFQATLLLGYLYSHFVIQKFGIERYRRFHIGLILLTLLFFPGRPLPAIAPVEHLPMVLNIFWQLSRTIGVSFFLLSTTSIIFQSWLASSELPEKKDPYSLYGVSNLGSFAALLTYPFLFEMSFDLGVQLGIWRFFYIILVLLHIVALRSVKVVSPVAEEARPVESAPIKTKLRWFALGGAGVIMFLSITNIITYEIAPIPLLWIVPLSIYLLSFVLNFKRKSWCPAWIRDKFHLVIAFGVMLYFMTEIAALEFMIKVMCYIFVLFATCMFCQNELYARKPQDSRNLTEFYLVIALGGFCGGVLVSWIMPLVTASMAEYLIGLLLITGAMALGEEKWRIDNYSIKLIAYLLILVIVWPFIFSGYNIFGILILWAVFAFVYSKLKARPVAMAVSVLVLLGLSLTSFLPSIWGNYTYLYRHRNYYGFYKVYEAKEKRSLTNGSILHGAQYLSKDRQSEPLTYYSYSTPVGAVLKSPFFDFKRIGIVGLGTGTLAAYGAPDRTIDFFELDPEVYGIAKKYFTYLDDSKSKITYVIGDARLSLAAVPAEYYDILIVDAFSGDSIPIHLLTVEAITEYQKRITRKGIVLFHVSNRYLDLAPVLFANANTVLAYACMDRNRSLFDDTAASEWVAMTWSPATYDIMMSQMKWKKSPGGANKVSRPWTDTYSNILSVFQSENLLAQVRNFRPFYWDANPVADKARDAYYYFVEGSFYMSKNEIDKAIRSYQKSLKSNPASASVLNGMGFAYYRKGDYPLALEYFKKAVTAKPNDENILYNMGNVYFKINDYEQAIECYKKSLEIKPNDPDSLRNLARAYSKTGQPREAKAYFKKAIDVNPNAFDVRLAYQFEQEVSRLEEAIRKDPKDAASLNSLGGVYFRQAEYGKAIECYKRAMDVKPDDVESVNSLGYAYYTQGNYPKALELYQKGLSMRPKDADVLHNLGNTYYKTGAFQKAVEHYQSSIDLNPKNFNALHNLGKTYIKLKKYQEALACYQKIVDANAADGVVYVDMALAYGLLGDRDKAVEILKQAKKVYEDRGDENSVRQIDECLVKLKTP
jgi:tetratricopeptide (TPR) repeat protein